MFVKKDFFFYKTTSQLQSTCSYSIIKVNNRIKQYHIKPIPPLVIQFVSLVVSKLSFFFKKKKEGSI